MEWARSDFEPQDCALDVPFVINSNVKIVTKFIHLSWIAVVIVIVIVIGLDELLV